jgi:hypothetical protein
MGRAGKKKEIIYEISAQVMRDEDKKEVEHIHELALG